MVKSPPFRIFEAKLARMNDLLCYYLFSDAEVEASLSRISSAKLARYTTETFPANPYAGRLHIRTNTLEKFRKLAFHTSVGVSLVGAVEFLLNYIKDIEGFRALVLPTPHDGIRTEKPEEQLNQKLQAWSEGCQFDGELVKTIRYLRLRRNHFAHVREEMSQEFKHLLKNDAHHLNKYWASQPTDLYDFNFSDSDFSKSASNEALALINLVRVCQKKIDACVMSSVGRLDIARYEAPSFLVNPKHRNLDGSRQADKFRGFLKFKYGKGFECTDTEFFTIAGYA